MVKALFILSPEDENCGESKLKFKTVSTRLYRGGPFPPLGLLSLLNVLQNKLSKTEIQFFDGQLLSKEEIIGKLNNWLPDFVGIGPSLRSYGNTLAIARSAKSLSSKVILGGYYASSLAKEILSNRGPRSDDYCVDAIVQRDGEEAICDLVEKKDFNQISNLIWQDETGRIIENKIKDLDINETSFNDRDCVNVEEYFERQQERPTNGFKRGLTMISHKGCAWRAKSGGCVFCPRKNQPASSTKSPELFWDEVISLRRRYKTDFLWDVRDDFLEDEEWLENLVSARPQSEELGRDFYFRLYARVDNINEKTIKLLQNLNLPIRLIVGFESGSDKMLKAINKGCSSKEAMRSAKLLSKSGFWFTASFVLGCPGESRQTLFDTVNYAKKLKQMGATITAQLLKPYPNSRAFALLADKNKLKYGGRDIIDYCDLIKDWVDGFCDVGLNEVLKAFQEISKI